MALVCAVATTDNIDATYSIINQKPTLTLNSTGVLTVDGRDILVGDVVLVKDQVFLEQNAVYQCYIRGAIGVAAVLVLYYQFSTLQNINNCGVINIIFGDTNQNTGWVINSTVTAIGVSHIEFVNFVDPNGLEHAKFINFVGGTGNNTITFPDNEFVALNFADTTDNPYLIFQSLTSSTTRLNMRVLTGCTLRTEGFIEANQGSIVWGTTSYSTGTAALNLTTVTGSGTTFPATCAGGSIYFPNQALYALIVSRDSATQLTVANTGTTFTADDFIIYYSGTIIDGKGLRQLNNQTLVSNNIDTPSSATGVGTALALGATNATSITLRGQAISLGGTLTTAAAFTTSGANSLTLTTTGSTNVTLPTTGTLATTAGTVSSVSGTLNRITSTGGTTPVIDISASYVGQSSITTLGTIATGTWQGTVVGATYGGTGVNNGASTITLGGSLTTSGANALTLTTTGYTNVTLPTTGTLVNSAVTTLSSLASIGTITTGVWNGTVVGATYGGTGVNNGSSTITLAGSLTTAGANALTLTTTGLTNVTLPTSGTLVNSAVTTLSSLASIGTVTTGVWNGTVIGATYGGTGVNNGASTITLGGSLTTSGAFSSTFTMTASTSVTFPTSGTLATTAGTVSSVTGTSNRITSSGGTTPAIDISASYVGQSSITTLGTIATGTWQGSVLGLTYGGTNANLTASNGGILYSTATAAAILSGTATAGQLLQSGASAAPTWSTTTYPSTNAINTLLYASSANVMAALATANSGVLITSAGGAPSISSTLPSAVQGNITSTGTIGSGTWQGTVVGGTYGGTGVNNGSSTITLGGSFTTSGAFTTTLIATATTSVTLPTSGTLATTQGLPMTVVSGTSQSAAVNNSYVSNNASLCTITLPSTAAVGDSIQVGGLGAGGWKVAQNASQLIHLGSAVTTTGTGGSLASTNQYDAITVRCVVANTTWNTFSSIGNITVV